jgi:hypothetical protein
LQSSPSQHPAHDVAVQVHSPCEHSWLEPHAAQDWPPIPQAAWVLPGAQLPELSQQPPGQLEASQVVVMGVQVPNLHDSLLPQVLHALPPAPQAASLVPATQAPWASQHPLLQVVESQLTALQAWFSQISFFLHA